MPSTHPAPDLSAADTDPPMNASSPRPRHTVAGAGLAACVLCALGIALATGGCATPVRVKPELPPSLGHLATAGEHALLPDIPAPVRSTAQIPRPTPAVQAATYSVVVSDVPVRELLLALARDTRQNIDIHPGLAGRVTLNAIDETLPAILERISRQVEMRMRSEGATLVVQPDTPFLRVYPVDYVNMQRDTLATIGASGQIGGPQGAAIAAGAANTGSAPAGGGSAVASGGAANASATLVRTTSQNHFWETLRENLRAILAASRAQAQSVEDRAQRAEQARQQREERLAQAEAVSRAGPASTTLFNAVFGPSAVQTSLANDLRDSVVVNALAGTVNVLATERQHLLVQQYLDGVMRAASRQVLIEATIAEVRLDDAYQAGVDWSRLRGLGGISVQQQLLGSTLGAPPLVSIGYMSDSGAVASAIRLLQQFGNTQVLSSPKIMALNNQTSVLRVTDNFVYFQVAAQQGAVTAGGTIQPTVFNTTAQTVPVGVVLAVTPQINDSGQVTLTVRPTITRVTGTVADPNPSLRQGVAPIQNLVPVIQTRELESVLQVTSGQTVILGGLMQDDASRNRDGVPWLSRQPGIGDLFSLRSERVTKTELVIFIRPTVVTHPSLQGEALHFLRRVLPPGASGPSAGPVDANAAPARFTPATPRRSPLP
jgi:MSHA type pilus biogenesis protein MshL